MGALQFTSSPFLPLVTCEVVKSSLQYGVCEEASTAFASYAMLKVALEGDYSAGRYWADIVREIIKKYKAINKQSKKRDFPHFSARLCFVSDAKCYEKNIWLHTILILNFHLDFTAFWDRHMVLLPKRGLSWVYWTSSRCNENRRSWLCHVFFTVSLAIQDHGRREFVCCAKSCWGSNSTDGTCVFYHRLEAFRRLWYISPRFLIPFLFPPVQDS